MLPPSLYLLVTTSDRVSGKFTVNDSPAMAQWDEGQAVWSDQERPTSGQNTSGDWTTGINQQRDAMTWDAPDRAHWDENDITWPDAVPAWDTEEPTDTRTWVIGAAGPFGANVTSATGVPHTARLWIRPPDAQTAPQLTRRQLVRIAVQEWLLDPTTCATEAEANHPGDYSSAYHRWVSYYLNTH